MTQDGDSSTPSDKPAHLFKFDLVNMSDEEIEQAAVGIVEVLRESLRQEASADESGQEPEPTQDP